MWLPGNSTEEGSRTTREAGERKRATQAAREGTPAQDRRNEEVSITHAHTAWLGD